MEIKDYVSPIYNTSGLSQSNSTKKSDKSSLGIDDFLTLLAAQLANQDMMNPSSDTEFIAQLAQFSSLQAMDSMAKMTTMNQSTNLVGKNVIVAKYDSNNKLVTEEGIVEKVTLSSGMPKLYVNGNEYEYSNVMEIKKVQEIEETEPDSDKTDEEKPEGSDDITSEE
ncbi:flagellar hook capping protein [Sedimentibacter sp. zth1]|uniref:flagellar hook capping FlgD N-terminal domain-containing protein n=1 Tax=Sedimentibacter sp. zth1 TaxID=2816908 RepID=UPI001A91FA7E|nr:flagellar hook capping FlgD N-terminal domain-containing protein [Sedimentibacter sp. zth1]QSX07197.1 flagellar hook capping protein [Sedimentibacter sp. zth1]